MIVEILTKVVATLSGNSLAMIAKLAVRKAAFPKASTILIRKDSTMKGQCSFTWSRSLRSDGHTDVRAQRLVLT